jgi:glycosyltransferase involved in cell wall biosynthesis
MKVSIIITNYNYGAYLVEAIDSALDQTHDDTEVIVVDDGSQDNSAEIIKGYGDRIIPIFRENGGQCASLNTGFRKCQGDVVILLDADDILMPSAVERHLERFQDPDVVKSCGYMEIIDIDGNRSGELLPASLGRSGDYLYINLENSPNLY